MLNRVNEKVWNFFASTELAVALFITISTGAAIGTVIPQSIEPEPVIKFFSKFMSISSAHKTYEIINLFDLNNVYHSWWFTFLLFMFALNLIVCSIDRLPTLLKSFKAPPQPYPLSVLDKMPIKKTVKINNDRILEKIKELFQNKGFSTHVFETQEGFQIQAKKWNKTRLAVYLTHLSILIILAGALIGTFFGFRGSMNIVEGTGLNFAISDEGKAIPLGFEIRCERFEAEYYENSAIPKAYRSYLKIIESGKPVRENIVIEVNHPFTYRGITFYQASYGFQPTEHAEFKFTYFDKTGKEHNINVHFEENFKIPGTSVTASVVDFSPALGIDEEGRLFNMSSDMINPAVLVEFENNGKKTQQWILKKIPESWQTPYGKLRFNELWGAQFTGLQVRRDPGVPLIYTGSILMCLGLFICLFLRPVNYFAVINKNQVVFYCPTSKGMVERQIDEIIKKLKGDEA
ncbi:cytochrome c biogenesis protein ResB [Thermodesulfovibrio sp. 3907-1M]|uniref:Cytochrome c biogenesis protein ResB n=1 Tax=Thermodesulfovibrio autotrophicus TaxID=3118333 RepID=A0AAU8GXK2_9BACT